jgi:hypothetical protein
MFSIKIQRQFYLNSFDARVPLRGECVNAQTIIQITEIYREWLGLYDRLRKAANFPGGESEIVGRSPE